MAYYSPFDPTQEVGASEYKALKQDFDATQAQKTASAIVKPETPNTQNTQVGSLSNTLTEDVKEVVPNLSNALTGTTISSQPANSLLDTYKESYTKFETDTQKRIEQLENEKQQRFSEIENVFGEEQARLTERQGEQTKTEEAMGFRLGTDKGTPYGVDRLKNLTKEHQYQQSLLQRQKQDALNKISAAISDEKFQLASQLRAEYKDMLSFEANERDRQSREYAQAFNQALQMRQEQRETEKYEFEREESLANSLAFNLVGLDENFEIIEAGTDEIMAAAREMDIDPNILFAAMSKQASELRKESREERGTYFERQKFAADLRQKTLENSIAQEKLGLEKMLFGLKVSESGFKLVDGVLVRDETGEAAVAGDWAKQIASGKLKMSDVPAELKSSVVQALEAMPPKQEDIQKAESKISELEQLLSHPGITKAVGTYGTSRINYNPFDWNDKSQKNDFIGKVEKLLSEKTLQSLIDAKADGATFGALSEGELRILQSAASVIGTWKRDTNGDGVTDFYEVSEKSFKEEITRIKEEYEALVEKNAPVFKPFSSFSDFYERRTPEQEALYKEFEADPAFQGASVQDLIEAINETMGFEGEKGGLFSEVVKEKFPTGSEGGQCGVFAHKLVTFPNVGDLKEEKQASVRKFGMLKDDWLKDGPKVGDVIITNEDPTYGHVAVINKILPNGDIMLSESNYRQKDRISHDRKISKNSSKIYGVIRGEYKV